MIREALTPKVQEEIMNVFNVLYLTQTKCYLFDSSRIQDMRTCPSWALGNTWGRGSERALHLFRDRPAGCRTDSVWCPHWKWHLILWRSHTRIGSFQNQRWGLVPRPWNLYLSATLSAIFYFNLFQFLLGVETTSRLFSCRRLQQCVRQGEMGAGR